VFGKCFCSRAPARGNVHPNVPFKTRSKPRPAVGWSLLACLGFSVAVVAAPVKPVPVPVPGLAFHTPVQLETIDAATYAEWCDGTETTIKGEDKDRAPQWVLWTGTTATGNSGIIFGNSRNAGPRHLRLGFQTAVPVGSVLVNGGGRLSVLRPAAAYPGNLNDETQWIPAQRLHVGQPVDTEVKSGEYALWVLPPGTTTRALRFTHVAVATDTKYEGALGAALVMADRFNNAALQATAAASAENQHASRINNGANDAWKTWENRGYDQPVSDGVPVVSPEHPEWVLLAWAAPVKLNGLIALWAGFAAAEAQTYTGPADRHPRDARSGDWETLANFHDVKNGYPAALWPNHLDFGRTITTGSG